MFRAILFPTVATYAFPQFIRDFSHRYGIIPAFRSDAGSIYVSSNSVAYDLPPSCSKYSFLPASCSQFPFANPLTCADLFFQLDIEKRKSRVTNTESPYCVTRVFIYYPECELTVSHVIYFNKIYRDGNNTRAYTYTKRRINITLITCTLRLCDSTFTYMYNEYI